LKNLSDYSQTGGTKNRPIKNILSKQIFCKNNIAVIRLQKQNVHAELSAQGLMKMLILGLDTSCDETSVAVVRDGREVLSSEVSTQHKIHARYGGVVPELASRAHVERIDALVDKALAKANISFSALDAIGVTYGPGLSGSLLVGLEFSKSLAYSLSLPLVPVNHIEAHLYANFLEERDIEFPYVGLVVSGGHTILLYVKSFTDYNFMGQTRDDACGEAFDKGAKILGLGYPGGPEIEKISRRGDSEKIKFPRAYLKGTYDFSFSGLKTALLRFMEERKKSQDNNLPDIAASFQEAAIEVLIKKTLLAAEDKEVKTIVLGGGVVANSRLREKVLAGGKEKDIKVYFPKKEYCTDNSAMIAGLSYWQLKKEGKSANLSLAVESNLYT